MNTDYIYSKLLADILTNGKEINSRNSKVLRLTNLITKFNTTPLISVRKTAWKNALLEFEWFMSGSSNINDLDQKVRHWWSPWAKGDGRINYGYGEQFRNSGSSNENPSVGFDQLQYLVNELIDNPFSRRNVISTWNTADMASPKCPITNCHGSLIMTAVNPDKTLDLTMVQRSADMILGVPHNWIQYYAFLLYLSKITNLNPGSFTWIGHDCHIYEDHIELAKEIVKNGDNEFNTPTLVYNSTSNAFLATDFSLSNKYNPLIKKSGKMIV